MIGQVLPRALLDAVDDLALSIIVLNDRHILYRNTSARTLAEKLRREHRTDLLVLLRDQAAAADLRATGRSVSLATSGNCGAVATSAYTIPRFMPERRID